MSANIRKIGGKGERAGGVAHNGELRFTISSAPPLPAGMYVVRMAVGEKIWAKQVAVVG